jgi:hypothetical protein
MRTDLVLAIVLPAALWLLLALAAPPVRRALLAGLRCVGRHPDLWRIPMLFGVASALFQLGAAALLHARLGEAKWFTAFAWAPAPDLGALARASLLPAAESAASAFTIFTATFPLSAWFAILFVCNFAGLLAELARALRRRFGRAGGALLLALLVLCALAAIAKPAVYLLLPEVLGRVSILAPLAINLLSIVFELLLGIFFLTYLMLMAEAWRRGIQFHRHKLLHVAMRRTGFVLRWSLLVAALATAFLVLPVYLGLLVAPGGEFYDECAWAAAWIGRPLVAAVALFHCPVQAILVFHNESLRQALRESRQLLRKRGLAIIPYIAVVLGAFFALEMAVGYASARLEMESLAALSVRAAAAWIEALLAGWFIAGWVCLYKDLTAGRKEILF